MVRAAEVLLILVGVGLLIFGGAIFIAPAKFAPRLNLLPQGALGISELRAVFGGAFFAFGLVLLGALLLNTPWKMGLVAAVGAAMGFAVLGRLLSVVLDGYASLPWGAFSGELLIAIAAWIVVRHPPA